MAVFNLTDFTGKLLSTCFYRITGTQLMTVALLRLLLVPAMTLCVTPRMDPFFGNPLWPILFTVILGMISGAPKTLKPKSTFLLTFCVPRSHQRHLWLSSHDSRSNSRS